MDNDRDLNSIFDAIREILLEMPNYQPGVSLKRKYMKLMAWFFETLQFWQASINIREAEAHYDLLQESSSSSSDDEAAAAAPPQPDMRETFENVLNQQISQYLTTYIRNNHRNFA